MMQTRRRGGGFTLIELLTVIGIIVILVSILLPVVSSVRKKSYQTSSAAEISRISSAVQAYYADFMAYPGPVPDNALYPPQPGPTNTISGISGPVTSSENFVLGLLGGLVLPPGTALNAKPVPVEYQAQQIIDRRGPSSLNPASPRQYASYINVQNNELSTIIGTGPTATFQPYSAIATPVILTDPSPARTYPKPSASDTAVPEFMDHFPTARPIICLRARVGAPFMYLQSPAGGTQAKHDYQYDPNQLKPYWAGQGGSPFPTIPDVDQNNNQPVYTTPFDFFKHPTINDSPNPSNPMLARTPRGKDAYILISAGADGIYGTKDDIIYSN